MQHFGMQHFGIGARIVEKAFADMMLHLLLFMYRVQRVVSCFHCAVDRRSLAAHLTTARHRMIHVILMGVSS